MSDDYILDENHCPRLTDWQGYLAWHSQIPEELRTGIGCTLARTATEDKTVSTVFLRIDHAYGDEPPFLWETMLFCDDISHPNDEHFERSHTRREALAVHREFCRKHLGLEDVLVED